MNNSIRLFTAFPLSPQLKKQVYSLQNQIRKIRQPNLRLIGKYELHITLHFLGNTDPLQLKNLQRILAETAEKAKPVQFTAEELGAFPSFERARGLTLNLADTKGDLLKLYRIFEGPLVKAGLAKREASYSPHITLARVRGRRGIVVDKATLPPIGGGSDSWFQADRVILYRSELTPAGARYYPEGTFLLGGHGRAD